MIGKLDSRKKHIVVVGAGLSGLLAAYELSKNKTLIIEIYEASNRVGGLLKTENTNFMLAERAANSFLVTPSILEVCKHVGVEMIAVNLKSKARFIFRNNRPHKWPLSVWESLLLFLKIFKKRRNNSPSEDSSLSEWADFHFGESARRYLLDPFCTGIYACTTQQLCVGAVFPQLVPRVGQSVVGRILELRKSKKEKSVMMTPALGLEDLCLKLKAYLLQQSNVRLHLSSPVQDLEFIDLSKTNVILATHSTSAGSILTSQKSSLGVLVNRIQHASIVSVVVNISKVFFEHTSYKPQGVGILLCPGESDSLLGILFNSSSFSGRCKDQQGQTLTLMFKMEDAFKEGVEDGFKNSKILKMIQEAIRLVFKCESVEVRDWIVSVWPKTIPIYNQELLYFLKKASIEIKQGQVLVGSYTGKLGIRSFFEDALILREQMSVTQS